MGVSAITPSLPSSLTSLLIFLCPLIAFIKLRFVKKYFFVKILLTNLYIAPFRMTFFNSSQPVLRLKQEALDIQDLSGLLRIHWKIGDITLFQTLYTRIDQVFALWGGITAFIFGIAQFYPISWTNQAIAWSVLTLMGTAVMAWMTWYWVKVEKLRWVVYCWSGLMLVGVALTDYGIFWGCGWILLNLCPIWLGLSAVGYLASGVGMRSRTFLITGLFHLIAIPILAITPGWQFLNTGVVMSGSLFLLSGIQWDMRSPIETNLLTAEQKAFNRQQHRLRQLGNTVCRNA